MTQSDLSALAAKLAKTGAPIVGAALGGPVGQTLAPLIVGALCDALGLPEDAGVAEVVAKIDADPVASQRAAQRIEATSADTLQALELQLQAADLANARAAQIEYVHADSPTQWAPIVVTTIVLTGFAAFSWIAMRAQPGTTEREVVMWLLGSWQTLAGAAVSFWLGSSSASKAKDAVIAAAVATRATNAIPFPTAARAGADAPAKAAGRAT